MSQGYSQAYGGQCLDFLLLPLPLPPSLVFLLASVMGLSSGPSSRGAQSLVRVSVSCHKPTLTAPLTLLSTLHPGSCGISASFVASYFYVQPTKNPASNLLSVLARKLDPEPWECAPRLINARYTMLPFTLYLPPSNTLKIHSHTCSCQYILVTS